MIVPFPRAFQARDRGRDVQAVQRALRKAGFRRIPPTGIHGTVSQRNVRRFQAAHRLPATGTYDVQTHRALASCFDLYGASLMAKAKAAHEKSTLARQRHAQIVAAGTVLVNNAPAIHYTQGPRRMDGVTKKIHLPDFPEYADCSSAATWLPWQAGAPDPMTLAFQQASGGGGQMTPSMTPVGPGDSPFAGSQTPMPEPPMQ